MIVFGMSKFRLLLLFLTLQALDDIDDMLDSKYTHLLTISSISHCSVTFHIESLLCFTSSRREYSGS